MVWLFYCSLLHKVVFNATSIRVDFVKLALEILWLSTIYQQNVDGFPQYIYFDNQKPALQTALTSLTRVQGFLKVGQTQYSTIWIIVQSLTRATLKPELVANKQQYRFINSTIKTIHAGKRQYGASTTSYRNRRSKASSTTNSFEGGS